MDKWQGTVEIREVRLCNRLGSEESKWPELNFLDGEGWCMFSIMPHKDNALHMCAMAGQAFVLDELGWDAYDEVCRRMKGARITIDLSAMGWG